MLFCIFHTTSCLFPLIWSKYWDLFFKITMPLTKESMLVDEYTNTFTNKMEFTLWLILDERTKIERYANGLRCRLSKHVHLRRPSGLQSLSKGWWRKEHPTKLKYVRRGKFREATKTTTTRRTSQATSLGATSKGSGVTSARRGILATVSCGTNARSRGISLPIAQ